MRSTIGAISTASESSPTRCWSGRRPSPARLLSPCCCSTRRSRCLLLPARRRHPSGWRRSGRRRPRIRQHRWSSAGAFVDALARSIDSGATHAGANAATVPRSLQLSRRVWAAIAAGALVAMAGIGLGVSPSAAHTSADESTRPGYRNRERLPYQRHRTARQRAPRERFGGSSEEDGRWPVQSRSSRATGRASACRWLRGRPIVTAILRPVRERKLAENVPAPTPTARVESAIAVEQLTRRLGCQRRSRRSPTSSPSLS